jgi:putative ABC transport system permease protein
MARINFAGLLSNGRADLAILGEGIEPDKEARLGSMVRTSVGRRLNGKDRYQAEVGHGVARALKLKTGDRATLLANTGDGAMNTLDVEVVGVCQSFSKDYDNRAIRMPLSAAQELLNAKGANTLVVSLKRTKDTDRVAAILREQSTLRKQEIRTWSQLNDFHPKTVALYDRQFGALLLIILLMVLISVNNSVNMTVFERTAEFGTTRALGNRGSHVLRLVLLENMVLGLVGGVAGVVLGIALAEGISAVGIPMPPPPNADLSYTAYIRPTLQAVTGSFLVGFLATSLAAVQPAIRMARMPIALALRQGV